MPNRDWDEMLAEAAGEVLETMFCACVYGPAEPGATMASPHLAARLEFAGTPSGALTLSVSEPAVRTLADSLLPSEEGDPPPGPQQLGGVVRELANMICGSLLSRVKTEEQFRLSSPEPLPEDGGFPPEPPNRSLDLGDGSIDLWLGLEQHAG